MGKTQSKSATVHNADPQVKIINNQELHSESLQTHEVMLWVIMCVSLVQLLLTAYEMLKRRINKRALKIAKSLHDISHV